MSANISQNPFYKSTKFAGRNLHLGVSGSIACYKSADLLRAFLALDIKVSATLTSGARAFITPMLLQALGATPLYGEMFDDPDVFAHLQPGARADMALVAPASANLLSRLAVGSAADMLAAQLLAFNGPVVIAPAMNPRMWAHPATCANVKTLRERGCIFVEPGIGGTACGDEGRGRLAELPEIFLTALRALSPADMGGLKVMVTLGPTREKWDGVRFWSNPSSGRMGAALATAAWLRGAVVTAISGPGTSIFLPTGIKRIDIESAKDMYDSAVSLWPDMDVGMFCAAVADFAPQRPEKADAVKIAKSSSNGTLDIRFFQNADILATLAKNRKNGQRVLGFAAEITPDMPSLLPRARAKLERKQADIIAANRVNPDDGTFGADNGSMAVVDCNGIEEIWAAQSKADIAWELCSWLLRI